MFEDVNADNTTCMKIAATELKKNCKFGGCLNLKLKKSATEASEPVFDSARIRVFVCEKRLLVCARAHTHRQRSVNDVQFFVSIVFWCFCIC